MKQKRLLIGLSCLLFLVVFIVNPSPSGALCLSVEFNKHGGSTGYFVNSCSVGVNVTWYNKDNGTCGDQKCLGCRSRPSDKYTCATFVPAQSKSTATVWGETNWYECESKTLSDVLALEDADGEPYCSK